MRSLGETQALFRRAVAGDDPAAIAPLLRAPHDPVGRLEIYRRHYRESFRRHLRGRYPTLEWLVGTDAMVGLADSLLQTAPPRAPSLAEYGAGLVDIVAATRPAMPAYLADVARLDWHLGALTVATDMPAIGIEQLSKVPAEAVPDVTLQFQSGLAYQQSSWPVDQLLHLRLSEAAPEQLEFATLNVWLELRGSRGRFWLQRRTPGQYAFRRALAAGRRLGVAAEHALGVERNFDLSTELASVFAEGLVTAFSFPHQE